MKTFSGRSIVMSFAVLVALLSGAVSHGKVSPGKTAPSFVLTDLAGRSHDLSKVSGRPMTILYFFDGESRPSQEGLVSLNELAKRHKGSDLAVWAITRTTKEKVAGFGTSAGITFPILLDGGAVGDLYGARVVLPTVCILGPSLKVLDYFQGGGKTTETMLVRVAERTLQRRQTKLARAISEEVIRKNPRNVKARTVSGYAALKEDDLKGAEKAFTDLSRDGTDGEVLGKEGLAAVYVKMKQPAKALQVASEVEKKAPGRAYVHVIKGDVLYAQNRKKEAEAEYRIATRKDEVEPYQSAVRYNQLGRFYGNDGQSGKARELYEQALTIDPFYIEGTTNKGLAYEKEGRWDKALESYRQGMALDGKDTFAAVLARKAQEMLDLQKDSERSKRVDQLVKDLAARYKSRKESGVKPADEWTSAPMVLTFIDFQEKGGLAERDGLSAVLAAQLAQQLNASGRVRVVERAILDRLLAELNLGSSELADPETALRLGKILAARLIGTGSLLHMPGGSLLSLRLVDTETSAIPQVTTRQIDMQASLEKELFLLNREILKTVVDKYPLQGFLVKVDGDKAIVNLGSKQGVVGGTKFEILEEQEPITYKGKVLRSAPKQVALVEVTKVEPDLCQVKVIRQDRPVKADDKVREKLEEVASK